MVEFKEVSLYHGASPVLLNVSLRIAAGERIGIIGPNGSGKSTLFQLITGELLPTSGAVEIVGAPRIGHVRQHPEALNAEESLLDYGKRISDEFVCLEECIAKLSREAAETAPSSRERENHLRELGEAQHEYEHLGGYAMEARVKAALRGLGFSQADLVRPFREFSGGWRMRAELARIISGTPDLLLMDEPSNYLDLPAVEWLRRFLREYRGTMLLISHDRWLLMSLVNRTVDVDACSVTRYAGDVEWTLKERASRRASLEAAHANVEARRERIMKFVNRFRAQSSKASQVQSRIKELERLPVIVPPRRGVGSGGLRLPPAPRCSESAMSLNSVSFGYEEGCPLLEEVSLDLNRGDRLVIVGYNGMGKTTLLRLMAGRLLPWSGKVVAGHNVRIGYQSQDATETLPPGRSVLECVREASRRTSENELRTLLGGYGFGGDEIEKPCGVLSGGEKIRLAFACLAAASPNLLLLDEPTTHLDIDGRIELDKALKKFEGAIGFVSHDVAFVRSLATSVVYLSSRGVIRFPGGYDDFSARYPLIASDEAPEGDPPRADREGELNPRERRRMRAIHRANVVPEIRKLKSELARHEARIVQLEEEQQRLAEVMIEASPSDHAANNRRLAEIAGLLEQSNHLWEETGRRLEESQHRAARQMPD